MSSALLAGLFAILGVGLAVTSTACLVLWRRVRALTSTTADRPASRRPITIALPGSQAEKRPSQARYEMARRLDDLASRHQALEARLAKLEASTTEAALAIPSRSSGSKFGSRVDQGRPAIADGPTLISVPNLASPPSSTSQAAAELDRRFGPIWGMADEGVPTEAIARESGYPIGQVELILGLRRRLLVAGQGTGAEAGVDA
jgi:hypothetical protein